MADVLSQSQIDALLKAANSTDGSDDSPSISHEAEEKKYRKYDFYSPRKFTKDRIRIISGVFENYSRIINSRLNGILHTSCEVTVKSVEEQRYYEFSNAISENDVLTLVGSKIENAKLPEDSPIIYHFSTQVMLSMMDRLMGGMGDIDGSLNSYIFTDLELKLYESLAQTFVKVLSTSWENYINIEYNFEKVETNPTLVQIIGLDETVVIVGIDVKFENCSGQVSICLPGMMLTNIFSYISANSKTGRGHGEDNADEILDMLKVSDLEIKAELTRTSVRLSDINTLNVGDVINLNHPIKAPVSLFVGEKVWFSGMLGTQNNSIAVKIRDTFHNSEEERKEM